MISYSLHVTQYISIHLLINYSYFCRCSCFILNIMMLQFKFAFPKEWNFNMRGCGETIALDEPERQKPCKQYRLVLVKWLGQITFVWLKQLRGLARGLTNTKSLTKQQIFGSNGLILSVISFMFIILRTSSYGLNLNDRMLSLYYNFVHVQGYLSRIYSAHEEDMRYFLYPGFVLRTFFEQSPAT